MRAVLRFFRALVGKLDDDNVLDIAAMLTYYALFALFPMALFVVTITLMVLPPTVLEEAVTLAARHLPPAVSDLVVEQMARMQAAASAGVAVGSLAIALWGASGGLAALTLALNRIFGKVETRPWWRRRLAAIGITLLVAVLMVAAMGLLLVGPIAGDAIAARIGYGGVLEALWRFARLPGAALLVMLVWAALYSWLPNMKVKFRVLTPGAIVGVAMWLVVTQAFGFYVSRFSNLEATYGTLASVVVFMTWLWLSNLAILFGAEVNDVVADLRAARSPAAAALANREAPRPLPT